MLQDSETDQMAAPDELAQEEGELRAQREEEAKKAFKVMLTNTPRPDIRWALRLPTDAYSEGCRQTACSGRALLCKSMGTKPMSRLFEE